MLVLTRKERQRLFIGPDIIVTVCDVERGKVRIGISAPRHVPVYREECVTGPADPRLLPTPQPEAGHG
jgi:carbon storage regulator